MRRIAVGVIGYGVIGQRLADGVARQPDMELAGIADVTVTLPIRALKEKGMPYRLFLGEQAERAEFERVGIPVSGTMQELAERCDVLLDATSAGQGAKNLELYKRLGKKAIFQGGEKNSVADVFFHGCANYEKGLGQQFLKLTSCNTTGLIRAVDCLDRAFGLAHVAVTIIRRVADPGDYHRGLTNALQVDPAPSHQVVDLMTIMPQIKASGILVHTPVTHGHIITLAAYGPAKIRVPDALQALAEYPRIRLVQIRDGFLGNASLFRYARDLGNPRGDMYEIAIWEESVTESGDGIMLAINIPQEAVTIPETIDGIRACLRLQTNGREAVARTNEALGIGLWRS